MADKDFPATEVSSSETVRKNEEVRPQLRRRVGRRSFLKGVGFAGAAVSAGALLPSVAFGQQSSSITKADAAILRFLSAAEILETDLWQQYNELGGVQDSELPMGGGSKRYREALEKLDEDMPQYIHDNTEDELSHFTFINSYLESLGAEPVNLDKFRTLPSSKATGARKVKRLTNLMELTVDTTCWTRTRSRTKNPDRADSYAPAVTDPKSGLVCPNLKEATSEDLTANLIMPEPTAFLNRKFPVCSIIRPTDTEGAATGAVKGLTEDGLFRGQSKDFFRFLKEL